MARSRIAIFEGWNPPRMGAPLFDNPRMGAAYGRPALGRRGYYVPPERGYGPLSKGRKAYPIVRKGYKVKRMKDTPAMKRAQARMKKAAKFCSRRRKGSYVTCMKKQLRKKR